VTEIAPGDIPKYVMVKFEFGPPFFMRPHREIPIIRTKTTTFDEGSGVNFSMIQFPLKLCSATTVSLRLYLKYMHIVYSKI